MGQTPTLFQRSTYPEWAHEQHRGAAPRGSTSTSARQTLRRRCQDFTLGGVVVRPDEKLITYVSRDLEPYRGFHIIMRALPRVLQARPDVRASCWSAATG